MPSKDFRSTDRDAPVLSGDAGTAINVLTACLVQGTPAQTVSSLTRSGSTATLTATGHGYKVGQEITVTGATEAEWNGNWTVDTVPNTDDVTYTLGSLPAGSSATGTIKVAGEKTVGTPTTVSRSGSTVTVNLTSHGFSTGQRFRLEGANETDYNGVWTITAIGDSDNFDFDIGSATPSSPATGTILIRYGQAGLGWTIPFTGASKAAYKQGGGNGYYLRVNDANNDSTARAYVTGYTAMTDVDSGSNAFPNSQTKEVLVRSVNTTSTARKWYLFGSEKLFHLLVQTGESFTNGTSAFHLFSFGDFKSFNTAATYDTHLWGRQYSFPSGTGASNAAISYEYQNYLDSSGLTTRSSYGLYAAGTHSAVGETQLGKFSASTMQYNSTGVYYGGGATAQLAYPNALGNSMILNPIYFYQASPQPTAIRGSCPGVWVPAHLNPANNEDTLSGSGDLAGKSFIVIRMGTGTLLFETSDTWDD